MYRKTVFMQDLLCQDHWPEVVAYPQYSAFSGLQGAMQVFPALKIRLFDCGLFRLGWQHSKGIGPEFVKGPSQGSPYLALSHFPAASLSQIVLTKPPFRFRKEKSRKRNRVNHAILEAKEREPTHDLDQRDYGEKVKILDGDYFHFPLY
jgi:hypothetical protein